MGNSNDTAFCSKCGAACEASQSFCSSCGQQISAGIPQGVDRASEENEELFAFVQKKQYYYLPRFFEIEKLGKVVGWNWGAAIFGAFWCVYRKMYLMGFTYWAVNYAITKLIPGPTIKLLLTIAFFICTGVFANYVYFRHVSSKLATSRSMDGSYRKYYLKENGGTSIVAVWILLAIVVCLALATSAIF